MVVSDIHRLEFTEEELCERIGCVYQTLRSYLDGYKFNNVERIKIMKYKPNTDMNQKHKRKSKYYKYILSDKELLELLKLRKRYRY